MCAAMKAKISPAASDTDTNLPPMQGTGRVLVLGVIVICCAIEAVLTCGDLGWIDVPRLRQQVYEFAGFWPGLLRNWRANYAVQPYTMFLSYAFLHAGPVHLLVNMITLWSLGKQVLGRVGPVGFALLYLASILGGALGFGLLAETVRPMVGASGALFGLAGGVLAWAYVDRFTWREGLWPIAQAGLLLLLLNVVLWWAMNGQLAWQTHLGGFIAGWVAALLIDPRPRAQD